MSKPTDANYSNDAREGRTNAGQIEVRTEQAGYVPTRNRAYLRSLGTSDGGRVCPPLSRRVAKKNAL